MGEKVVCNKGVFLSIVLSVLLSFSLIISVEAEASWVIWSQTYGGTSSDYAEAMVQTSDGGYALAGSTWSFGAGASDFWLVKTDAHGNMEWNQTYGGTEHDQAYSLVETSDGGYALAGYTSSTWVGNADFWLVKTNEQGVPEFPSWAILPLFIMVTLVAIIIKKRLTQSSSPKLLSQQSVH